MICKLFRAMHRAQDDVEVVLGVDAMAMEPVEEAIEGAEIGSNNVFLFHMMPLRCQYKSLCLHTMTKDRGNAGPDVLAMFNLLKEGLEQERIFVKYLATDGDAAYQGLHDEMFDRWWKGYEKHGLDKLLTLLDDKPFLIVGDMLHLLKNTRARLIGNTLTLNLDGSFPFDAEQMNNVLGLGPSLLDRSSKGKMRDQYALDIFNFTNFLRLAESEEWGMAFFILPYAMWVAAVTYSGFSTQMGIDWLNFAFEVFVYHIRNISQLDTQAVSQNNIPKHVQYCCSRRQCVRILNTLLVQIRELRKHPDNLAIGRIGTHGLECVFGTVRLLCHHKHSWKRIRDAFAKMMVFKDLTRVFGHVPINGRLSSGGVKIFNNQDEELAYIKQPETSVRSLFECVHLEIANKSLSLGPIVEDFAKVMRKALDSYVEYIKLIEHACELKTVGPPKQWTEGAASHNGILARLILFNQRPNNDMPEHSVDTLDEDAERNAEEVLIQREDAEFIAREMPHMREFGGAAP